MIDHLTDKHVDSPNFINIFIGQILYANLLFLDDQVWCKCINLNKHFSEVKLNPIVK